MSDENDSTEGEGIKNLRKQYDEIKKQLDARDAELAEFRAAKRQASVAEILKAKGIPSSAAKLYTGEDASEDAVGKWLNDYADVFNIKQNADNGDAQNAQRISDAAGAGFQGFTEREPAGKAVLGDPGEIAHALKTLPYEELVKIGLMPDTSGQLFRR